ncbi:MAG: hypothetical protein QOI20_995 [Acidimicrobiaceae bacterium]|nr:hypothetical protein [Acidimicrobiaceae bacterium]
MTALQRASPVEVGRGYWDRLEVLVRPESRVDIYRPADNDPILRQQHSCAVPACRTNLAPKDLYCGRHEQQWHELGEPSLAEFLALVPPVEPHRISGGRICMVEGCENPKWSHGWCRTHDNMWKRLRQPEGFAATAPPVRQDRQCRVPNCGRPEQVIAYGLCGSHRRHWAAAGEPPLADFIAQAPPVRNMEIVFSFLGVAPGPKLELQFVLQQRRDVLQAQLRPAPFIAVVLALRSQGPSCRSILDLPVEFWEEAVVRSVRPGDRCSRVLNLGFLRWAYAELSLLGPDDPFAPDIWQARRIKPGLDTDVRAIDWTRIPQPWLREAAKRWGRVRATTLTLGVVTNDARRLARFAQFLATSTTVRCSADITRDDIEAFLARIAVEHPPTEGGGTLSALRMFLDDAAENGLLELRREARVRRTDYPRPVTTLPRFLPESVMAVLEAPASLALLADNGLRGAVKILMGTGRRSQEVLRLPFHCVEPGPDGDPYLRFFSGKMAREDMIPIDAATASAVADQQVLVLGRWPAGSRWLFPRPKLNPLGVYPFTGGMLNHRLQRWVEDLDLRETLPPNAPPGAVAPLVRLTSHRFRHTIATRMINEDLPQYVVQRFLGHKSAAMTERYAAIHDKTLAQAFKRYRERVTASGEVVVYQSGAPMTDGLRLKDRLERARQSLPNGYCARPLQTDCIHPNFCIGCTQFASDVTFLPVLRGQRARAVTLEATCIEEGRGRWAERNRKDITALDAIIETLEDLPGASDFEA